MNLRQKHLLALGITEYANALDHLRALRTSGVHVSATVTSTLSVEHARLMYRWQLDKGIGRWDPRDADSIIEEARAWTTTNISAAEELLRETG